MVMQDRILEILTKTNITIEEMENIQTYLEELEDDRDLLYALQAAGVDNWYGYEEAMKIYNEEEE
jgi:hypothetical protein